MSAHPAATSAAALLATAAAACGHPHAGELRANAAFECHDRMAAYMAVGTLAAPEVGVQIDCAEMGPRIVRWSVDKDGQRSEVSGSLSVGEFDDLWKKIDGTGWRNISDCSGTGQPTDPVYNFDVRDWNGQATFGCASTRPLPFPFNSIVDELDFEAARHAPKDGAN